MSRYLSKRFESLAPYVPGEQPKVQNLIKLNTNENPYPPSPKVIEAITGEEVARLRLYSDPDAALLVSAIAKRYGVKKSQVFVGNGSDEVLGLAFLAFGGEEKAFRFPALSYGFYPVFAKLFGVRFAAVPLREDFTLDPANYMDNAANIVIANPNAPTGLCISNDDIRAICRANPDNVVVIDEAYADFADTSAVSLLAECENLLIVQTFSKSRSLAGMRIGFALGSEELIDDLQRMKFSFNPYNLDRLAILAGTAAMNDEAYFAACTKKIVATRERTYQALCAKRVRMQLFTIIKFLVSLFIGFLIYAAVAYLFSMRWGAEFSADWQTPMGEDLLSMWLFPIVTLLDTPTAYPLLCALIYLQLLAACWALFLHKAPLPGKVFALLSLLLLPFSLNMPVFAASPVRAVREQYVLCLLPVALISLLDLLCGQLKKKAGGVLRVLFACAFGVTFLSSIVFSNQVYLKKNLEYQTTLSVMTRVVEQAEQTEGFIPGYTPVAIVGSLENSTIAMAHKGFEHLSALDAAANNYTASSQSENTWYFWEIMGYPFNFVSDGQRDALAASDAVQSMPAFPAKGFCSTVDGVLVIKLSPSM